MDLFQAVMQDDVEMVAEILASRVDPNVVIPNSNFIGNNPVNKSATPLHIVKSEAVARLLIEHNADVNKQDFFQYTPLHNSICPKIISILLEHKADVNSVNHYKNTPLVAMLENKQFKNMGIEHQYEIVDLLLKNKANPNKKNKWDVGSLHLASSPLIVRTLLEYQADPNMRRCDGCTPLHIARDKDVLITLLDYKADPDARNVWGASVWHFAGESWPEKKKVIQEYFKIQDILIKPAK